MECFRCAAKFERVPKYCSTCGNKLLLACPKCGFETRAGTKECPSCKGKIGDIEEYMSLTRDAAVELFKRNFSAAIRLLDRAETVLAHSGVYAEMHRFTKEIFARIQKLENQADTAFKRGKHDESLELSEHILALSPGHQWAVDNIGEIIRANADEAEKCFAGILIDKGLQALRIILKANPRNYESQGKKKRALDAARTKLLQLAEANSEKAHEFAAVAMEIQPGEDAEKFLKEPVSTKSAGSGTEPHAAANEIILLFQKGEWNQVIASKAKVSSFPDEMDRALAGFACSLAEERRASHNKAIDSAKRNLDRCKNFRGYCPYWRDSADEVVAALELNKENEEGRALAQQVADDWRNQANVAKAQSEQVPPNERLFQNVIFKFAATCSLTALFPVLTGNPISSSFSRVGTFACAVAAGYIVDVIRAVGMRFFFVVMGIVLVFFTAAMYSSYSGAVDTQGLGIGLDIGGAVCFIAPAVIGVLIVLGWQMQLVADERREIKLYATMWPIVISGILGVLALIGMMGESGTLDQVPLVGAPLFFVVFLFIVNYWAESRLMNIEDRRIALQNRINYDMEFVEQEILKRLERNEKVVVVEQEPKAEKTVESATKEYCTFTFHTDAVLAVCFSRNSRWIASGGADRTIRLWDVETKREIHDFKGHAGSVTALAFSPDKKTLASGSSDNLIKFWDVENRNETAAVTAHRAAVTCLAFSPDGKFLFSGSDDKTVRMYEVQSFKEVRWFSSMPLTTSSPHRVAHSARVKGIAVSPDGRLLATCAEDKLVKVWEIKTGKEILVLTGHTATVNAVKFSADGAKIISGGTDKKLIIWDAASGKAITTKGAHSSVVYGIDCLDGKIASCSADKTVKLWDASGNLQKSFSGHTDWVKAISFSADGRYLCSCSTDKTVRVWEIWAALNGK